MKFQKSVSQTSQQLCIMSTLWAKGRNLSSNQGGTLMYRILILDDDASIRLFYEEELTDEGYDVLSDIDGTDFSELVMKKRPDLVVLDLKLGAGSGFELLKELKAKDCRIPILLCTGYDVSLREARAKGADDVVIKSSDLAELKFKIKKALKGRLEGVKHSYVSTKISSIAGECRFIT
jgi:DNA-binding response OmpR family regulator